MPMPQPAPPQPAPPLATWLGLAGLLPFAAAAAGAWVGPDAWRGPAVSALAAYGAVILSFLGAVHWGFALGTPTAAATRPRLLLGVLPALVGWLALLLPTTPGLVLLASAVLATAAVEAAAARHGLMPEGYMRLRWVLSIGAGCCLLAGSLAGA